MLSEAQESTICVLVLVCLQHPRGRNPKVWLTPRCILHFHLHFAWLCLCTCSFVIPLPFQCQVRDKETRNTQRKIGMGGRKENPSLKHSEFASSLEEIHVQYSKRHSLGMIQNERKTRTWNLPGPGGYQNWFFFLECLQGHLSGQGYINICFRYSRRKTETKIHRVLLQCVTKTFMFWWRSSHRVLSVVSCFHFWWINIRQEPQTATLRWWIFSSCPKETTWFEFSLAGLRKVVRVPRVAPKKKKKTLWQNRCLFMNNSIPFLFWNRRRIQGKSSPMQFRIWKVGHLSY